MYDVIKKAVFKMTTSNQRTAEVVKLCVVTKSPVIVIRMVEEKYPENDNGNRRFCLKRD